MLKAFDKLDSSYSMSCDWEKYIVIAFVYMCEYILLYISIELYTVFGYLSFFLIFCLFTSTFAYLYFFSKFIRSLKPQYNNLSIPEYHE